MGRFLLPLLAFLLALPTAAAGPFRLVESPAEVARLSPTPIRARSLRPFFYSANLFADALRGVAKESLDQARPPSTLLELPHPEGRLARFRVIESPVMAPELAAKFPDIRTFRGEGMDDPTESVRFDISARGFSAMVFSASGIWYVTPWAPGVPSVVASFFRRDALRDAAASFRCEEPEGHDVDDGTASRSGRSGSEPALLPLPSVGPMLRTYRLALATTGEYSAKVCAPDPAATACATAALVTAMNRVNGIYERELAIRMVLVGGNDSIVYTNGETDPYSNNSPGALPGQNQVNLDGVIGDSNYDMGHVFSTGGGGAAGRGVVCRTGLKAYGSTGLSSPFGDAFYVDYVAHEMGHQFGANHTFNGSEGACAGASRHAPSAFEPGSGSTIMAYAGICGTQNLQLNSDPYFHAVSFDEIVTYSTLGEGSTCASTSTTSNSAPAVEAGASYTIPSRTPFLLTGNATDPENDPLTYGWEELDLGAADVGTTLVDDGSRPVFRSFNPSTSSARVFPRPSDILAETTTYGETLPATNRTMTFRLTARDNRTGGGGVNSDTTTITSVNTAGPFSVTAPVSVVTWTGNTDETVTWDTAGTAAAPISCMNVAITFSSDGGMTFPTSLLLSTPNDGSQPIIVPNIPTTTARIKVACVENVFFAVSRASFTVTEAAGPVVTSIDPASGTTAGGTPFVVTGTGFGPNATITVGGVAATSVVVHSSTSIAAVSGVHPSGTVDVVVTNPDAASGALVSGYTYLAGSSDLRFYTVEPCRMVDTRNTPDGPLAGPILAASPAERSFSLVPGCGIPAGAKVVSANVTVTGGGASGSLRVFPADAAPPTSTTISFGAGKTRANNALLLLSAADGEGRVTVRNDSTAPIHLIVDVNGYFQ